MTWTIRALAAALLLLSLSGSLLGQGAGAGDPQQPPDRVPGSGIVPDGSEQQPWENYSKHIQSRNVIGAMGPDLFGDEVNLYNGALSFRQDDAGIPGNFALPVGIARSFSVTAREFDAPNDLPFADWDLEVPRLEGTFGEQTNGTTWVLDRCSGSNVAPSIQVSGGALYTHLDYFSGVQAQMPGGGELLRANSPVTPLPSTTPPGGYRWVTPEYTYFSCLSGASSANDGGEGFLAITADGTKYTFNRMARYFEAPLARPMERNTTQQSGVLTRYRVALYATRVEDRFGNWVEYSYTNTPTQPIRLSQISSSDNRSITLTYNSNGHVATVTENDRTWTYSYSTLPGRKSLTGVSRTDSLNPGDSWVWLIDLMPVSSTDIAYSNDDGSSQCDGFLPAKGLAVNGGAPQSTVTGSITHPSGAHGVFEITQGLVSRTNVPNTCLQDTSGSVIVEYPLHISRSRALKLLKKTITGPGMAAMDWSYSFGSASQRVPVNPNSPGSPTCHSDGCVGGYATAIVVGPAFLEPTGYTKREWSRFTFGNSYGYNEGKLLKTERGYVPIAGGTSVVLEQVTTAYALPTTWPPPLGVIGSSLRTRGDGYNSELGRPRSSEVIERISELGGSTSFSWSGSGFSASNFYRPTDTTHSSTLGFSRTEALQYHDDTQLWVLGQVRKRSVMADGQVTVPLEITAFNTKAQPTHFHRYGRLDAIHTYHPGGQLSQIIDGVNTQGQNQITSLNHYHRGIPQLVAYADGSGESAIVNNRGEISSHTDPSGATTGYQYDALGLVKQITYPSGDIPSWHPTVISFRKSTSPAVGLPAGHWRREVITGSSSAGYHRAITHYNALWQPVLSDEHETIGDSTEPVPETRRMINRRYDSAGREFKVSFPVRSITSYDDANLDGRFSYSDALGRVTHQGQDSELAPRANSLTKVYTYLSDFRTQVADENERLTIISYQAFDQPSTDWPIQIDSPKGNSLPQQFIVTTISRDVYGKPLAIRRVNPQGSNYPASTLTRSFYYDAHQRLCKRVEPESGATYFAYHQGTNNLQWQGHTSDTSNNCDPLQVLTADRIEFGYDNRNRLTSTTYLDGITAGSTRTWTADGLPNTVTQSGAVWTYGYNRRRLLTSETLSLGNFNYPLTYGYSAYGARSEMSYPDASVVLYQPNRLGEPTQVQGPVLYASGITHHPNGALASFQYGNTLNYSVALNERLLPQRVTMHGVYNDVYTWDALGNLSSITDEANLASLSRDRTMGYDYANRLVQVNSTALGNFAYQYDDLDNLRHMTRSGIGYTYAYDSNQRLSKLHLAAQPSTEALGYLYDSRGNVTQRRPGGFNRPAHDFIVDKANRTTQLSAIGSNQALETYLYDGNGRRVQITDANSVRVQIYNQAGQFVYETSTPTASSTCSTATPPNLIFCSGFEAQQGGGNPTSTRHIHLAGKQIARTSITSGNGNPISTTTFVHTDLLGSVVAESTQAPPQITHRPLHEPYGAPSNGQYLQGPDYTGHVTDTLTGLSYMQARYYDPLAGRFLGVDPVGVDLASGGNFNRYWYANSNPYKYTDPDGRNPLGRNMPRTPQEAAPVAELAVDFTPIIGDIKAIAEAFADPTMANIASAVIGLAGPIGDGVAKIIKTGTRVTDSANKVARTPSGKRVGDFSKSQKDAAKRENAKENTGEMRCVDCGKGVENIKSEKGVPTPDNQAQVHHDPAIKDGGGQESKAIVLCPPCHRNRHANE